VRLGKVGNVLGLETDSLFLDYESMFVSLLVLNFGGLNYFLALCFDWHKPISYFKI
jgi:hypothetical protein